MYSSISNTHKLDALWDAIVIGAGPAGCIAARQLALQGKQVLLVDKARLPRDKVCGGCIGGAALEVLQSIGLGRLPTERGAIPLDTFAIASDGQTARVPIGRRAALSRRTFDRALCDEAKRCGVIVLSHTLATLCPEVDGPFRIVLLRTDPDERIARAKIVIIATGLAQCPPMHVTLVSPASRIGLGAILDEPPCSVERGTLNMACTSAGYVGVTAVENGCYDIAAAVDPHALTQVNSPGQLIERILGESGFTPTRDLSTVKWHGTPPLTRRCTPLASHRCLLVGDAAGYVEPFTGEGIGWAISSAVLAASLLAGSLDAWSDETAVHWERAYRTALSSHQRSCRVLSRLLRVKPLRRVAIWSLRQAPSISRGIVTRLDRPIATCI